MAKSKATNLPQITPGEFIPNTDVQFPKKLPVLSRGQKPGEKDMLVLANFICDLYSENVHPLTECLQFAGIRSAATWMKWVRENETVKMLYEKAKKAKADVYRGNLRELAVTSAEKQITGYTVPLEEVSETVELVFPRDEAGNIIPNEQPIMELVTARTIKRKVVYVKPSPTMTLGILYNTDPDNFKRIPTEDDEAARTTNIPPIDWVD